MSPRERPAPLHLRARSPRRAAPRPGQTAGIVSPGSPVATRDEIAIAREIAEALGLRAVVAPGVSERYGCLAGSDRRRADDLNAMFTLEQISDDPIAPSRVPAWSGAMIGHITDPWTVPVGSEAEIDADAGTIRLLQPAVTWRPPSRSAARGAHASAPVGAPPGAVSLVGRWAGSPPARLLRRRLPPNLVPLNRRSPP